MIEQLPGDASNEVTRNKVREIIAYLNKGVLQEPAREVVDLFQRNPSVQWSAGTPREPGKWHMHPSSERMILDPHNNGWMIHTLTDEQWEEALQDIPDLSGKRMTPDEVSNG